MYRQQLGEDPEFYSRLIRKHYTEEEGARFVRRLPEELDDFELAIQHEAECLSRGQSMEWSVLELGLYGPQLQRYFEIFPHERLLVLDSNDLRKAPRTDVESSAALSRSSSLRLDKHGPQRCLCRKMGRADVAQSTRLLAHYYREFEPHPRRNARRTAPVRTRAPRLSDSGLTARATANEQAASSEGQ